LVCITDELGGTKIDMIDFFRSRLVDFGNAAFSRFSIAVAGFYRFYSRFSFSKQRLPTGISGK
jgi:hypothetical protein